MPLHLTFYQNQ